MGYFNKKKKAYVPIATVEELIKRLQKMPPESKVFVYWEGSCCDNPIVNVHPVQNKQGLTGEVQITTI